MSRKGQALYSKIKHVAEKAKELIKDRIEDVTSSHDILGSHKVTAAEIAQFIQGHPDRQMMEQTLLGLTYRTYRLQLENAHLYMETKTVTNSEEKAINGERILIIEGRSHQELLFQYRSYEDKVKLQEPVRVQQLLSQLIGSRKRESLV